MWMVDSCKELDTFGWSPKGYTIKSGKRAAFNDRISAYPVHPDGYNRYFDLIPKIKNLKLKMNRIFFSECQLTQGRVLLEEPKLQRLIFPKLI